MELEHAISVYKYLNKYKLHYSYMELELFGENLTENIIAYYIIPIWNWSLAKPIIKLTDSVITLFLYGIGAVWVFSLFFSNKNITLFLYGIGA